MAAFALAAALATLAIVHAATGTATGAGTAASGAGSAHAGQLLQAPAAHPSCVAAKANKDGSYPSFPGCLRKPPMGPSKPSCSLRRALLMPQVNPPGSLIQGIRSDRVTRDWLWPLPQR